MAHLLLFAGAREAAGTKRWDLPAELAPPTTVGAVLDAACLAFGSHFANVVAHSKVWRNGEPADRDDIVTVGDEVAVLPPVSGG
jgi:molybdopterin converting factor small subunit